MSSLSVLSLLPHFLYVGTALAIIVLAWLGYRRTRRGGFAVLIGFGGLRVLLQAAIMVQIILFETRSMEQGMRWSYVASCIGFLEEALLIIGLALLALGGNDSSSPAR